MAITNIIASNSVSTASGDAFTVLNGDVLNVLSNGYLVTSASGFSGVYMNGGNSSAMILGQVLGQNTGIFAQGATAWTKSITIGETGVVGAVNNGIRAETGSGVVSVLRLNNSGQILATGIESAGTVRSTIYASNAGLDIVNSGTIGAHPGFDLSIYGTGTSTRFDLRNTGQIEGNIDFASSAALQSTLVNSGIIGGYVYIEGGNGSDLGFSNHGSVLGDITLVAEAIFANFDGGTAMGDVVLASPSGIAVFEGADAVIRGNLNLSGLSVGIGDVAGSSFGAIVANSTSSSLLDLTGSRSEGVYGGAGGMSIILTGALVDGDILIGDQDDYIDLFGGQCTGQIDLNIGNDVLLGSNNSEEVWDGFGNDSIALGGGDDILHFASSEVGDTQRDTFDGGLGIDELSGSNLIGGAANVSLYINLEDGILSAAPGIGDPRVGNAEIIGFENVTGGAYHDILVGSRVANLLAGSLGNDDLQGAGGNDVLRGGTGQDVLTGGADKDRLTGGADIDRFLFTAASDSGASATKRDVIRDFQVGVDKIDLVDIDANPTLAGDQAFTFGSQITTELLGGNTLVKVDISGSAAPELTILLVGSHTLSATDFLL